MFYRGLRRSTILDALSDWLIAVTCKCDYTRSLPTQQFLSL